MHQSKPSRCRAIWFGLALVACERTTVAPGGSSIGPTLSVSPSSIDFGLVELGETATASVRFQNDGDEEIDADLFLPPGVAVDDSTRLHLGPGTAQVRTLSWTPVTTQVLDEHVDLASVVRPPVVTEVPVAGQPSYGALRYWSEKYEFGSVGVGCESEVQLELYNEGPGDLTVLSVALTDSEFALDETWATPRVIPSRTEDSIGVTFSPVALGPGNAIVEIVTDDLVAPVIDVDVSGNGVGPVSLQWDVPPRPTALTSLVDVNGAVASRMGDAIDSFFGVLRDSGLPFRVAILGTQGGAERDSSVAGPYAYIDDTFSADETHLAVQAMLDGIGGDEDAGLDLLESAIAAHAGWLLDEEPWLSSTLHLTVVNMDAEQSPKPYTSYLSQYRAYKDDPWWIVVDAVAGDVPDGCSGEGIGGAPSPNLLDATQATSGIFLSICDVLESDFETLASTMVLPMFFLDDPPFDSTITVTVDGTPIDSGWAYDLERNAIRFDEEAYPAEGSVLEVAYASAVGCE
jgi:hypothetical protein